MLLIPVLNMKYEKRKKEKYENKRQQRYKEYLNKKQNEIIKINYHYIYIFHNNLKIVQRLLQQNHLQLKLPLL